MLVGVALPSISSTGHGIGNMPIRAPVLPFQKGKVRGAKQVSPLGMAYLADKTSSMGWKDVGCVVNVDFVAECFRGIISETWQSSS